MSNADTVDFGDLGSFDIAPQVTLNELVAKIDAAVRAMPQSDLRFDALQAITRIRQRVFVGGENVPK